MTDPDEERLAERLRQYLGGYASYVRPTAVAPRPPRRLLRAISGVAGAAAVVGILVAAFALGHPARRANPAPAGSPSATASPTGLAPGVIPWKPLPPGPDVTQPAPDPVALAPAVPPGTPPCRASQLEGIQRYAGGYAQESVVPVDVRNLSGTACYLEGWSSVSALDSAGHVVATASRSDGQLGTYPEVPILAAVGTPRLAPDVTQGTLGAPPDSAHPKGQARLNLTWLDLCNRPAIRQVAIALSSGGGRLLVSYEMGANTGGTSDGCAPGTLPFVAGTWVPEGIDWPPRPAPPTVILSVTITNEPTTARVGSTIEFAVTLANAGQVTYSLDQCPNYTEWVGVGKGVGNFEEYQLNCATIHELRPGASVTFQMHLQVPASVPAGPTDLRWGLSDDRVIAPFTLVPLTITG